MSFWKKCPLLAAVIVSGLVIEGAGLKDFITTKFGVGYVIFSDEKGQE